MTHRIHEGEKDFSRTPSLFIFTHLFCACDSPERSERLRREPPGPSDDPSRVSGPAARPWGSRLRSLIPPREERHLAPSPLRARFQSQLLLPPLRFFSFRVSCLWRDIILPVLAASEPRRRFAGTVRVHWPPFCTGDRRGSATVVTGLGRLHSLPSAAGGRRQGTSFGSVEARDS